MLNGTTAFRVKFWDIVQREGVSVRILNRWAPLLLSLMGRLLEVLGSLALVQFRLGERNRFDLIKMDDRFVFRGIVNWKFGSFGVGVL